MSGQDRPDRHRPGVHGARAGAGLQVRQAACSARQLSARAACRSRSTSSPRASCSGWSRSAASTARSARRRARAAWSRRRRRRGAARASRNDRPARARGVLGGSSTRRAAGRWTSSAASAPATSATTRAAARCPVVLPAGAASAGSHVICTASTTSSGRAIERRRRRVRLGRRRHRQDARAGRALRAGRARARPRPGPRPRRSPTPSARPPSSPRGSARGSPRPADDEPRARRSTAPGSRPSTASARRLLRRHAFAGGHRSRRSCVLDAAGRRPAARRGLRDARCASSPRRRDDVLDLARRLRRGRGCGALIDGDARAAPHRRPAARVPGAGAGRPGCGGRRRAAARRRRVVALEGDGVRLGQTRQRAGDRSSTCSASRRRPTCSPTSARTASAGQLAACAALRRGPGRARAAPPATPSRGLRLAAGSRRPAAALRGELCARARTPSSRSTSTTSS